MTVSGSHIVEIVAPTRDVLRRWLREARTVVSLLGRRHNDRVVAFYRMLGTENLPVEESLYLNVGYWGEEPSSLDQACVALVDLVAAHGELGPDDIVLDTGFGFADEVVRWRRTVCPRKIVGVNLSLEQTLIARDRVAESGEGHAIALVTGSATALPIASGTFSVVLAVEAAHHFLTREAFFGEARRVLTDGGRLVTADVVLRDRDARSTGWTKAVANAIRDALLPRFLHRVLQLPRQNLYRADRYGALLREAGFEQVRIRTIGDQVVGPHLRYLVARFSRADARSRVNPAVRLLVRERLVGWLVEPIDYIVAEARLPAPSADDTPTDGALLRKNDSCAPVDRTTVG